ncbi:EST1A [Mytilus edulis]|uniref:SMG6 n=1 Tax=Mytilus edulis TaxID=6550 RepID=A0A8S3UIQ0_MYTED|nr:EST1A [Mytilus edulis]
MFNIICTPYDQVISVDELFCVGDSIWRQLKMAAKLKTVKITYGELENIVERKSENKPNSHQKDKINEKKRKTKRPEIGIYRPPSLLKQKNPVEDVDSGQQQLNEQGEIWEEEEHSTSSATNSKENSIEREINDGIKDLNVNEKHDLSKSRRKRPEIQRYVPKGKILEMQQNKNEDTESSGEVGDVTPLFIDEGSDTNDKKIDLKLDDIKNIKVTVSKDGESKQVSRSRSNTAEAQSVEDMPSASRSKSETQSTEKYQRQPSQRGQGDYRDYKGSKSDTRNRYSNVKKEGFSASPKPQRTDRRQGKFQPARNDNQRVPDEDLSDDGNVIQTMVFERKDDNQSDSKLTVENLSQKPPRGSGKQGSKRYSTNMRRPRAGSFSSDVSTASDLSIDEETTERILSWDREVEMEMAKQVHNETQKLKEYLEKQEGSVEWGKEDKHMNWSEMVADMPIDDIQDIPPDWEHIKPAGSVELLDKISSSKENEDIGQRNYQNAGTFPRRNKRNSGDRYKGSSIEGRNENWNAGSWDRRWNHDNKNKQDNDDYYRGYDRRERRLSNGSTGHRRRRQSRESNGRRSRDSSVSSVQSVRSNHGDEDMYGSYRRHKRQNSNSSLRGGSSRERLNEPESLNIKVTIGSDRRQVVVPEGDGKQQGKNVGRGRGRGRRQHGLDMSQGQRVGSRGPSEEPESIDMQRKDQPNRGGHNKEESSRGRNVGRGRGGRSRSKESVDWNRDRQGNKEPSDWNRDRQGNKEHGDWNRDRRGSKEHGDWNRDRHGNKEHGDWNRDRHGNKEHGDLNRDRHGNREHGDWGRDRYHGDRRNDYHSNRESNSRRGDFHGNRDFGSRQGGRSRNNSEREKDNKSPQVEKTSPQTHSGGLIKLPSNVHTTEEHKREEQSSHVEKEKETSQKSHNRDSVRDQRPSAGQKQLFDPKNPNKPIVIQESSNLKFQDTDSSNLKFQETGSPNLKFQEPAGMESPSPPAYPQNPPFQGYGPQYYGPQFPDQGMYGPPGPPMPPQMMPPHGYFYGYPPPQYYEMIRGKQREIMFDKMLNECLGLDNQLGNLVARRLNGESLSLLANQRQELTKRYEHLILIDIDQSTKHNVDQLLWKAVFYQVIEVFRKHMNEEDDSKTRLSQILDEGTAFYEGLIQKLQKNYRFKLDDFLDTHNLPPENIHRFVKLALLSSQRNMICLGDIARYREQMNDSGKVNYGRARNWYTKAQLLAPKNGRPYNQLAILALYTRRKLDAVYYYMRSLAASNPFLTARESLMSLFDEARKKAEAAEKKRSDEKDKHKNPKQQHQQQQHKHGKE